MSKTVLLKCGHTLSVSSFKPSIHPKIVSSNYDNWVLSGYDPECGATKYISIRRKAPSMGTLNKWVENGIAKALDGCRVEPDGTCEHHFPSWILALGMI